MLKNIRLILLKFVSSQTDRESAVFLDEQANIIIAQGCQRQISIKQMHTNPLKLKKTSGFHREGDLSSERGASRRSPKKTGTKNRFREERGIKIWVTGFCESSLWLYE